MKEDGAREAILGRVREALTTARGGTDALVPRPRPATLTRASDESVAARLGRFRERLESVGGHVHVVANETEAAARLAGLLSEREARTVAVSDAPVVARLLALLPQPPRVLPPGAPREELLEADLGLTSAQFAIAETGTLVLDSDAERHRLASLVPPVHVAVLDERAIVSDLDAAFAKLAGSNPARLARAVTLVTGPSRTADIELTLVVGVHGPRELHVLCLLTP